ncbi:MAG TPA: hypothetical protein VEJ63_14525 [Planctomycetota bacterium]|nr:hypothetical protein [Planctomycetota bacterium]
MPTDTETARRAMHRAAPEAEANFRSGNNRISAYCESGKWRRLSGITKVIEPHLDRAERRAHIARIASWIETRVKRGAPTHCHKDSKAQRHEDISEEKHSVAPSSLRDFVPSWQWGETPASPLSPCEKGAGGEGIGCTTDWLPQLEAWERVAHAGVTAEAICEELGIARSSLTRLLREYCGLSLGEFLDGLKLRKLKHELLPQLRLAARILWGRPGHQSELLAAAMHDGSKWQPSWGRLAPIRRWSGARRTIASSSTPLPNGYGGGTPPRRSEPAPADWREMKELRTNQKARAAALREVLAELRAGLRDDDAEMVLAFQSPFSASDAAASPLPSGERADVNGFSRERGVRGERRDLPSAQSVAGSFTLQWIALKLGFASPAAMKRACFNVFGKSLAQIEQTLAEEIVRYYSAAEDRVLREIASKEGNSAMIARARYHYHGDDEAKPTEPWLDAWSAAEAFQKEWLESMTALFG